jgi:hypothetical protein
MAGVKYPSAIAYRTVAAAKRANKVRARLERSARRKATQHENVVLTNARLRKNPVPSRIEQFFTKREFPIMITSGMTRSPTFISIARPRELRAECSRRSTLSVAAS